MTVESDVRTAPPVLAIELSQRSGGVALIDAADVVHEIGISGGRRDRDELAPAIAAVLAEAGMDVGSVTGVAVDVGPGGFTGLRVSVVIGQAIAASVGARVIAVPGALVAAASTSETASMLGRVLVLSAAKSGTAWGTVVTRTSVDDPWSIEGAPGILPATPAGDLTAVLADEHLDDAFRATIPVGTPIVEPHFSAAVLARLSLQGGAGVVIHDDAARLQPLYPREPEAVRVWRARRPDNPS